VFFSSLLVFLRFLCGESSFVLGSDQVQMSM
jgi:hypothetical protein